MTRILERTDTWLIEQEAFTDYFVITNLNTKEKVEVAEGDEEAVMDRLAEIVDENENFSYNSCIALLFEDLLEGYS